MSRFFSYVFLVVILSAPSALAEVRANLAGYRVGGTAIHPVTQNLKVRPGQQVELGIALTGFVADLQYWWGHGTPGTPGHARSYRYVDGKPAPSMGFVKLPTSSRPQRLTLAGTCRDQRTGKTAYVVIQTTISAQYRRTKSGERWTIRYGSFRYAITRPPKRAA